MTEQTDKVEFPMYHYNVYIVQTDNLQESRTLRAEVIGALDSHLGPYVDGLHCTNNIEPDSWVFFTPDSTIGTIAHECFHAVWRMFKWMGAKPNNEIMAYHLGYLVDRAMLLKCPK